MAKPSGRKEILDKSPSEKLLDAMLMDGHDSNCFVDAMQIFNPSVDIVILVDKCKECLLEEWKQFEEAIKGQVIIVDGVQFVHLTDFAKSTIEKAKITRKFKKVGVFDDNVPKICPLHSRQVCNLVPIYYAFLFFLDMLPPSSVQEAPLSTVPTVSSIDTLASIKDSEVLEEEPLNLDAEERETANFDVALFKAETIIDEPLDHEPISEASLTLPSLPFYHLNGKDYIPLQHIQVFFNIREDYCLATISEACEVAKGFLDIEDESKEEFLSLDLQTTNSEFLEAPEALSLCLNRVVEEKPSLKDKDFEARLTELGIDNFGRGVLLLDEGIGHERGSIDLEKQEQVEEDELQKIELHDEDNFLSRVGGSRGKAADGSSRKDAHALIHYLPKLDLAVFCAIHSQFSESPEPPLFALKTLSRFMGFHPLQSNSNKVLLLERAAALRIFGYAPGFQASRAGYFLCYSSYALASSHKDVKLLGGYSRRKFLRYKGNMPEDEPDAKRIKD